MGYMVQNGQLAMRYPAYDTGLGFYAVVPAVAAASGPAAPVVMGVVAAALGLLALGKSLAGLFHRGGKRRDTQRVEDAETAFHWIWYQVTGEQLPGLEGITATAQPGQYGAAGIDLFRASGYPNVPYGPAGDPQVDIDAAIASVRATAADVAQQMERKESVANLNGNVTRWLGLLGQVKTARVSYAIPASSPATTTAAARTAASSAGLPSWLLPAAAIGAALLFA